MYLMILSLLSIIEILENSGMDAKSKTAIVEEYFASHVETFSDDSYFYKLMGILDESKIGDFSKLKKYCKKYKDKDTSPPLWKSISTICNSGE